MPRMTASSRPRSFRFGVTLHTANSAADWRAKARRAEALGYDVFLMPDHIGDTLPPLAALMAAADATERVHLGTFVLNNDFRNPLLLAREAAALQLLSGGRFELGLGAGHMESEYDAAGIPFEPPPVSPRRPASRASRNPWKCSDGSLLGMRWTSRAPITV